MRGKQGFMTISSFLIGFMLMVLMVGLGMAYFSNLRATDTTFMTDQETANFSKTFYKYDETMALSENLSKSISDSKIDASAPGGFLYGLMAGSWSTLKGLFNSVLFIKEAFYGFSQVFGVPDWVVSLVLGIMTVAFVFSIWSGIYRWDL